jgi:hypothetical protein
MLALTHYGRAGGIAGVGPAGDGVAGDVGGTLMPGCVPLGDVGVEGVGAIGGEER